MKQTIEIEVPDGKKAIWKDNKVVFEDIKSQFPKTWEEFCEQNMIKKSEYYLDPSSCILELWDDKRDISSDRNVLPTRQAAEAHLALMQLHQLRDYYRQGWVPNLIEGFRKYCIAGYYSSITKSIKYQVVDSTYASNFLSFPTYELAEEFLTNFYELIEQAGDLI